MKSVPVNISVFVNSGRVAMSVLLEVGVLVKDGLRSASLVWTNVQQLTPVATEKRLLSVLLP